MQVCNLLQKQTGRKIEVHLSLIVEMDEESKIKKSGETCLWNVSYPSGLEEKISLRKAKKNRVDCHVEKSP